MVDVCIPYTCSSFWGLGEVKLRSQSRFLSGNSIDICALCYGFCFGLWSIICLNERGLMASTFKTCKAQSPIVSLLLAREKAKGEFSCVLLEPLPFLECTGFCFYLGPRKRIFYGVSGG